MAVVRSFRSADSTSIASRTMLGIATVLAAGETKKLIVVVLVIVATLWLLIAPALMPVVLTGRGIWCWGSHRPWFVAFGDFAVIASVAPPIGNSLRTWTLRLIDARRCRSTRVPCVRVRDYNELVDGFLVPIAASIPRSMIDAPLVVVDRTKRDGSIEIRVLRFGGQGPMSSGTYRRLRPQIGAVRMDVLELTRARESVPMQRVGRPIGGLEVVQLEGRPGLRPWDVLLPPQS